jgi:hypothetical protein
MKINKGFVTNKKNMKEAFTHITLNFRPSFNYATYRGHRYLVVPMVMLTEGVHEGSRGPLLYTNAEIERSPGLWNHKPVVIYHPQRNGRDVSACSPDVLEEYGVGYIFNASAPGAKLKAEAWLREDLLSAHPKGREVMSNIMNGTLTEVSTGLFSDFVEEEGEWQGEAYVGTVRNMRPDHLAILPDQQGACSIADGAGLLRNKDHQEPKEGKESPMDRKQLVDGLIKNNESPWTEEDRDFLMKLDESRFAKITANEDEDEDEEERRVKVAEAEVVTEEVAVTQNKAAPRSFKIKPKTVVVVNKTADEQEQDWISNAPPRIASVVRRSLLRDAKQKSLLIEQITKNERNVLSSESLNAMDIEELQGIAALLPPTINAQAPATYAGLADAFGVHQNSPLVNLHGHGGSEVKEAPLDEPVFNFSESK